MVARRAAPMSRRPGAGHVSCNAHRPPEAHRVRDLIVTENITIDGVIDASAGWFVSAGADVIVRSDQLAALAGKREAGDAFLVGRRTFEQMRSYWPDQVGRDESGVAGYLDRVHKYVVETTYLCTRSRTRAGSLRPYSAARSRTTSRR